MTEESVYYHALERSEFKEKQLGMVNVTSHMCDHLGK